MKPVEAAEEPQDDPPHLTPPLLRAALRESPDVVCFTEDS